jgi:hypothetical protein
MLIHKRSRYLRLTNSRILGYVNAPTREAAETAAVSAFNLTDEEHKRLVIKKLG